MHPATHSAAGPQPLPRDETHLPTGQCQYLLLQPELRGQRCACLRFTLPKSTPGSACSCGHLAVYHLATEDGRTSTEEELGALKLRVERLEQMLEEERSGWRNSLSLRLSELEEHVDKCRAESESEVKTAYRGIEGLWHNIGVLQKRASLVDDRIDAMVDANQATHDDVRALQERLIQLDDATMVLEDRFDALAATGRQPTEGTIRSPRPDLTSKKLSLSELEPIQAAPDLETIKDHGQQPLEGKIEEVQSTALTQLSRTSVRSKNSELWTVHISLLPSPSQPFPFEKESSAYRKCFSRGFYRVVAIPGTDSQSFIDATSNKFSSLLQGRRWMPLVSKICDAESLRGLPMLRQLPNSMIDPELYDCKFLKENCATPDADDNITDLYIALCEDTLSWNEIKAMPEFASGFEACWADDSVLDGSRVKDDSQSFSNPKKEASKIEEKPSPGTFLPAWSTSNRRLKRTASAISRTSSFVSSEGEGKRVKLCLTSEGQRSSERGDGQKLCEFL